MTEKTSPPDEEDVESRPELSRPQYIRALAELYEAGYHLHDELDDVDPGYEYALQQLCSQLVEMRVIDEEATTRAMNLAQERYFGEPKRHRTQSISVFLDPEPET